MLYESTPVDLRNDHSSTRPGIERGMSDVQAIRTAISTDSLTVMKPSI